MMLVADSGSTKTDWRLVDKQGRVEQFKSAGINPVFHTAEDIERSLREELVPLLTELKPASITTIHFYGAGCAGEEKKGRVANALRSVFSSADCIVEHDLLAAARALCGRQAGIACILGTGSNSCYYDGQHILQNTPSLGFIVGDEGSGAHLGKQVVNRYFYKELPDHLNAAFEAMYQLSREQMLERVYRTPNANRYLASFVPFLYAHKNDSFVVDLVFQSFTSFLKHQVLPYAGQPTMRLHSTGSVGFYFLDILKHACTKQGLSIGTVTESPIAGLLLYHREGLK